MSFKSETTKQAKKELKQEKKKMKTPNTKKTVIVTVVMTLAVLAGFAAQALYFYNLGAKSTTAYNDQVKAEAVALTKSLKQ